MSDLVYLVLATYKISSMITGERGPFDVFRRLRARAFETYGDSHWISDGITCKMCVGFWVSLILVLKVGKGGLHRKVLVAFAVSGANDLLKRIVG